MSSGVEVLSDPSATSGTMEKMNIHDRRLPLVAASAWALLWLVVAFTYHINQPLGELGVTVGGHTYTGNPPALTLYENDQAGITVLTAAVAIAITVSAMDVMVRRSRNYQGIGVTSAIAGGLLLVFSLFGLLWGLVSFGIVGLLLILASRPMAATLVVFESDNEGLGTDGRQST